MSRMRTPTAALADIVLPVGISFYTFATMSYTLDVYLRRAAAGMGSFMSDGWRARGGGSEMSLSDIC